MAETQDQSRPRAARRARTRRPQAAAPVSSAPVVAAEPAPAAAPAVEPAVEPAAVATDGPRPAAAVTREVISLYAALESASAEGQSKGHPLTLRRSGEGKYVAACRRCGLDLPVLDTARGWTYPTLGDCPNPVRTAS